MTVRKMLALALVLLVGSAANPGVLAQDRGAQLRRAVATSSLADVQKLAPSKDVVNSADSQGLTSLMIAAALGKSDVVSFLLKSGATIEAATTEWKATPLMFAANYGRLDVATALVNAGASLEAVDKDGYTMVDYCILPTTGQTDADRDRAIAVGKYLNSKGAPPAKIKNDDIVSVLIGTNREPDRLKKLIDGVLK